MNDPILHHGARRITPNSLEVLIEMFVLLGCKVAYREGEARWAMVGQKEVSFKIQLVEVDEVPIQNKSRSSSHVAFISEDPKTVIDTVEEWAKTGNIQFIRGGWSEKELWLDLPELLVDFVIEVMHKSIVEK